MQCSLKETLAGLVAEPETPARIVAAVSLVQLSSIPAHLLSQKSCVCGPAVLASESLFHAVLKISYHPCHSEGLQQKGFTDSIWMPGLRKALLQI